MVVVVRVMIVNQDPQETDRVSRSSSPRCHGMVSSSSNHVGKDLGRDHSVNISINVNVNVNVNISINVNINIDVDVGRRRIHQKKSFQEIRHYALGQLGRTDTTGPCQCDAIVPPLV